MAKKSMTARDPWDVEDESQAPDPWDLPEETSPSKPAKKVKQHRAVVPSEETQLLGADQTASQWVVKYPESDKVLHPHEIKARIKREKFLDALSKTGSPKRAAAMAKMNHRSVYSAREKYPDFASQWQIATEVYFMFEAEEVLRHRVIDGTLEPIVYQGVVTGYKRVYSDGLTQFWYKNNMRDKYGDKTEISLSGTINHGVALLPGKAPDMVAWEEASIRLHEEHRKTIDVTPTVVEDAPKGTKVSR